MATLEGNTKAKKAATTPKTAKTSPKSTQPAKTKKVAAKTTPKQNPFNLLNAYPDASPFVPRPIFNKTHYGLINEDNYCQVVDMYNLEHPENIFNKTNFFTDFASNSRNFLQTFCKTF